MLHLFITDQPDLATFVHDAGVERIFIDLETLGKAERQDNFDALISHHAWENIAKVRSAVPAAEVVVRLNPLYTGTLREIDEVVSAGADFLMLPMFRSAAELSTFCKAVRGRKPVIPLVETAGALQEIQEVAAVDGVAELHVGLNDLHRDLGLKNLFQPLAEDRLDTLAETMRRRGLAWGVGGVSRVGHGAIPGEQVMGEYCRLGSSRVILSRAFHQRAQSVDELNANMDFALELSRLREATERLKNRTKEEQAHDHQRFQRTVSAFIQAA